MAEISVIIPTWNRAETLGKVISSALNQTLSPYEVLVCGVDGSPDQKVVNSINDPRVRWIEGGKDGLASIPRNIGIKASKGDYDYWIIKLNSTGVVVWQKTYGGISADKLIQLSKIRLILLSPALLPFKSNASHSPIQKSNCRYSGRLHGF